jgi:hypothetical protein
LHPAESVIRTNWYESTKNDIGDKSSSFDYTTGKITELEGKYLNLWFEAYRLQFLDGDDYYKGKSFSFTIAFFK